MSDFAPPSGPPPPKVPEGWKAQWNDQYKEWFYVNIYTKKSQWDKPTEAVYPEGGAPAGPPPGYVGSGVSSPDQKHNPYENNTHSNNGSPSVESDAALAARLQAEEDAQRSRGAFQDYQNTPIPQQSGSPYQQQSAYPPNLPEREQKKSGGFLGKLLGKASGGSSSQQYRPQQYGGQPQYGAPQGGYGGYPQQGYPPQGGYGGYPQQGYGPPGGYGGGYPQQGGYGGRPQKSGGLGAGGAAALGVGGGLLGGVLLADALNDHDEQDAYQDGYQDGADDGGDFGE